MPIDKPEDTIVLNTTKGEVVIRMRPDLAPNHVARFIPHLVGRTPGGGAGTGSGPAGQSRARLAAGPHRPGGPGTPVTCRRDPWARSGRDPGSSGPRPRPAARTRRTCPSGSACRARPPPSGRTWPTPMFSCRRRPPPTVSPSPPLGSSTAPRLRRHRSPPCPCPACSLRNVASAWATVASVGTGTKSTPP